MPGFHLYRSNCLEVLAGELAKVLKVPLSSPLQNEIIVVQSLGMHRWLALNLAERSGITMNIEFPFPVAFADRIFRETLTPAPRDRGFDRHLLPWRILGLFPQVINEPAYAELARYVAGELTDLKQYQLAQKVAAVFDRYLAYRPELLLEWQRHGAAGEDWQPKLWRELTAGRGESHPPALLRRLAEAVKRRGRRTGSLPSRISAFGMSSLPPFHLDLLRVISSWIDVHFFLLSPTPEFWSDFRSKKEQERLMARQPNPELSAEDLHLESGDALLVSLGKSGREFSEMLFDSDLSSDDDYSQEPSGTSLLGEVQKRIFRVPERADEPAPSRVSVNLPDRSIQVHCCHGPMRELEVLYDQMLALFEEIPGLEPRDILVTIPDLETYAPFIEAVFGTPESESAMIPFTIADRTARAENSVADAFLRLLDLAGSRFGAATLFSLLETRAVQRRFDLHESDLETIREWLANTGIRWGIDADHRASLGQPATNENTWRAGLDRLLLGYAFPGDHETLFEGVLPVREVEGGLAVTLGHFIDFAETLFEQVQSFAHPRSLIEWEETLRTAVNALFDDSDDSADELRHLRTVLQALSTAERETDFHSNISFDVLRAHLLRTMGEHDSGTGFLAGRVTFCAMKPMRSIPFKVICLLGMNDGAFPRHDTPLAFDLTHQKPRRGDRRLRDDDRHLFLEVILSARHALYLSYSGLSNKGNKESPPSVLVSEFLDYLEKNFATESGDLREHLITRHRLQPFSPAYFGGDPRLFSFSRENSHAAQRIFETRETPAHFMTKGLPKAGAEWRTLDWDRFAEFFCHPVRFFGQSRLGLRLPEDVPPLEESEPQTLDGFDRYAFEQMLVKEALAGNDLQKLHAVIRASGKLPAGYPGDSEFILMSRRAEELAETIETIDPGDRLPPVTIDVPIDEWRLTGTLRDLHENALLRFRAATLKPKDQLRAWIAHLILQCATEHPTKMTVLAGIDAVHTFRPVTDPAAVLRDLLRFYESGLQNPLPFFPLASHEFARRTLKRRQNESDPLKGTRSFWFSRERDGGEVERKDHWITLCFESAEDPFTPEWQQTALHIYQPLFEHREEKSG